MNFGIDSFEARRGSDGDWVDVGSALRQNGRNYIYTVGGLSPDTEYTFSVRATGGGNTGDPKSVTARTITAATDYNFRLCNSGGEFKLIFSGLNKPGNALYSYGTFSASFFDGQANSAKRSPYSFSPLDKTTREVTLGPFNSGERLYVIIAQFLTADANQEISRRSAVYFAHEPIPACPSSPSRSAARSDAPKPTPRPKVHTLNHLPPGIQVNNWHDGAQGQQVDHVGVGRADAINPQAILDAVNIWGYVTPGIEVCFEQPGRLVFVDSVYPPVAPYPLPAYQRAGMTCTTIDTAGTVVLMRGEGPPMQYSQPQSAIDTPLATAIPSQTYSQALSGCEVRPWADVKFRQSPPGGDVISVTSIRKWLPASEKRYGYFKVTLWGREGWVSGDYVYIRGNCGA